MWIVIQQHVRVSLDRLLDLHLLNGKVFIVLDPFECLQLLRWNLEVFWSLVAGHVDFFCFFDSGASSPTELVPAILRLRCLYCLSVTLHLAYCHLRFLWRSLR